MTATRRAGYVAAAAALAAAVLLGGCTTPAGPPPPASSSTAGTPSSGATASSPVPAPTQSTSSPTTTGTDPNIPAAARANTPEAAQAFVIYAGSVFDNAFSSLDENLLDSITLAECKSCAGAKSAIAKYKQDGQKYIGKWANFTDASFASSDSGTTKVIVATQQLGAFVVDSKGSTVKTISPSKGSLSIQLRFDTQWRIAEMQGVA
jgi:hypothetical protein